MLQNNTGKPLYRILTSGLNVLVNQKTLFLNPIRNSKGTPWRINLPRWPTNWNHDRTALLSYNCASFIIDILYINSIVLCLFAKHQSVVMIKLALHCHYGYPSLRM